MHYQIKKFADISKQELQQLKKLILDDYSHFARRLRTVEDYPQAFKDGDFLAILVKSKDIIIGWALLEKDPPAKKYGIGVYVDPQFRRLGIGSKLIEIARDIEPDFLTFPHDTTSTLFFVFNKTKTVVF